MGPGCGWVWGSLFSKLGELRSTACISPDLELVPSNSYLIKKKKQKQTPAGRLGTEIPRNAHRGAAHHGRGPRVWGGGWGRLGGAPL